MNEKIFHVPGFGNPTGRISLESVVAAISDKFPEAIARANVAAAREAHAHVTGRLREVAPC